ncbi:MAG TPA: hypothetical protein VLI90_08025, partial [Tepidisphaeraceae bacterium]|nr:hypothetical protein [Tepidisphaeraceae bacterium]
MNLRPKTKRRLLVLIAAIGLLAGGITAFVNVQLHRYEAARLQFRKQGMAAYNRGDYTGALDQFSRYLRNDTNDPEALYAYAVARSRVPRPDLAHLTEAKSLFNRYLEQVPGDANAQHQLLEIYQKLNYHAEAVSLADTLLARDANDLPAMKAKLHALLGQSKYDEALTLCKRVNELAPLDLDAQKLTLALLRKLQRPPAELTARADVMLAGHPNDPRFELLRAVAASFVGDDEGAKKWVMTAATRPPPDPAFVRELTGVFDRIGMYDESRDLLEKSAQQSAASDPQLLASLAQRLWESGQYADVLDRLKNVNASEPQASSALLAYKALALYCLAEMPDHPSTRPAATTGPAARAAADAIVEALTKRPGDGIAAGWTATLKTRFANPPLPSRDAVKAYQDALPLDPDNAVTRYYLGAAYLALGENEFALRYWQMASQISPAWIEPHVMMARTLLSSGRLAEAQGEAEIAARRSPNLLAVQATRAVIAYTQLQPSADHEKTERLLEFVRRIQVELPGEPQTLPIYIALLTRAGHRDDAIASIKSALAAKPPLQSDTLLKLAQIDVAERLELAQPIIDALSSDHIDTAARAFDRAMALASYGRSVDGLKFITTAFDSAVKAGVATQGDAPQWQLAVAKYREAIGDAGVADAWAALGDANPKDIAIQREVLAARSAWSNRELIDRTIDRVKALTGDEGIEWRLARARWRLGAPDDPRNNANAAASMMADVVRAAPNLFDPLVVWAQALEKLGDTTGAIDRLRTAAVLSHGDVNVLMYLATLLQDRGNVVETRQILEQLSQKPTLSAAGRVQVARMYSMQGQYNEAVAVLRGGNVADGGDVERDLLLAQLLQAQGKGDEAAHVYDAVLQSPALSDAGVRAVAWFYARRQTMAKAEQALAKLNAMQLSPGVKELTLAAFTEQFNPKLDAALSHYQAATLAAPSNPATWKGLAGFHLRHRSYDAAAAVAEQGLKINAGDAQLAALAAGARSLIDIKGGSELQPAINAFAANPIDPPAQQTIEALAATQSKRNTPDRALLRLRDVADLYPKFLPAQMLLAERYFTAGRFEDADAIATRAMQAMPTEADPAHLLSVIAATAGHWDRALSAATEWRNRSLDQPLYADQQIAEAKLHLNDPVGALQQIKPYLQQAADHPDDFPQIVRQHAQALALQGQVADAQATLDPLLSKSPTWRAIWLDVAAATAR